MWILKSFYRIYNQKRQIALLLFEELQDAKSVTIGYVV